MMIETNTKFANKLFCAPRGIHSRERRITTVTRIMAKLECFSQFLYLPGHFLGQRNLRILAKPRNMSDKPIHVPKMVTSRIPDKTKILFVTSDASHVLKRIGFTLNPA